MSAWIAMLPGAALKSTFVVGAAWLLAFALRRYSAAARHLVWTAAAAALLALPMLSVSMPAWRVRTSALAPLVSSITFRTPTRSVAPAAAGPRPRTMAPRPWLPDSAPLGGRRRAGAGPYGGGLDGDAARAAQRSSDRRFAALPHPGAIS